MTFDPKALDHTDRLILRALSRDARLPLATLAREVGMSSPSVSDRLGRLQDCGAIRAFTIDLDPAVLGRSVTAIVRVKPYPGQLADVEKMLCESREVVECDKVTGDDCFVARFALGSVADLDVALDRIAQKADTNTAIVKSSPVRRRPVSL